MTLSCSEHKKFIPVPRGRKPRIARSARQTVAPQPGICNFLSIRHALAVDSQARQYSGFGAELFDVLHGAAQAAASVGDKGRDGLAGEIRACQKGHHRRRNGAPPVGRSHENHVIGRRVRRGGLQRRPVARGQFLFGLFRGGAVVLGIGRNRAQLQQLPARRSLNLPGDGPGVAGTRKVGNQMPAALWGRGPGLAGAEDSGRGQQAQPGGGQLAETPPAPY